MKVVNLVERFISALYKDKDIHGVLDCCSEDICCYSSLAGHACKGKENMLVMLVKVMEMIPDKITYKIVDTLEMELSPQDITVYVEYDMYRPNGECWMHGRASVIKTLHQDTWKIRYLHSSGYDVQVGGTEHLLEDYFFHQTEGFLGTDISYWYYDIVNKRIIHNNHSVDIHGFSNVVENVPESLIEGKYVHPDSAKEFRELYRRLEQGEPRVTGDIWIKPYHVDKYWCERIIYTTVHCPNGKPVIAMGISKDVTSEKIWNINMDSIYSKFLAGNENMDEKFECSFCMDMEQQIRNAITQKEFEIFLQPKVNSLAHTVCGAEALTRWRHPKLGILPPAEFIPKLEALELTHLLDYFAFESVCKYQKERIERNLCLYPISSNLSLQSLSNPEVIHRIMALIHSFDIPKDMLVIEVTETTFVSDFEKVLKHVKLLQSLGIKISMDDFGCGTSSFSQLANMPVDELKLDMKLVQNAVSTVRGNAILLSILKLAEWLEIPVIAEGLETKEQVEYLQNAGCFLCQGYYYSKPLSIVEFEQYEKAVCKNNR